MYIVNGIQKKELELIHSVYNQTLYEPKDRIPSVWAQRVNLWTLEEIRQSEYQYSSWFWDFCFCILLLINGWAIFRTIANEGRANFSFYCIIPIIIMVDALTAHLKQAMSYFMLQEVSITLWVTGGFCFVFFIIEYLFMLTCIGMVFLYPFRYD